MRHMGFMPSLRTKIMTEYDDYTSECIFNVSEEVVYSSLDESMKYLEVDFEEEYK